MSHTNTQGVGPEGTYAIFAWLSLATPIFKEGGKMQSYPVWGERTEAEHLGTSLVTTMEIFPHQDPQIYLIQPQ